MHAVVFLLVVAAAATPARADEVVARVDGAPVSSAALQSRLRAGSTPSAVLQDLLNDTVLALDAERQGLATEPAVVREVEAQRRRIAAERFLEQELYPAARVDEAVVREMFHAQTDTVRLNVVVVASEAEARAVHDRLARGATWADEARQSLDARGRASAGDVGPQSRGQLDALLAKAAFEAPVGALAGPVQLGLGWGVFRVTARELGSDAEFAKGKEKLLAFAREAARGQVRQHYLAQLRRESGLVLDEKFVEATGARLDATPEEEAHVLGRYWGKPLTYGEVLPEVRALARGMTGGHFSGPRVKLEVVNARANQLLLEEAAVRRGYDRKPGMDAELEPFRRDALVRAYAARLRAQAATPPDADVEAEYRARLAQLLRPGHRPCSQVLVESRGMAEKARARLEKGEPMATVARDLSVDPAGAAAGGAIGEIADDRLDALAAAGGEPDLAKAIRGARPGAVVGPVRSRMGWHVLSCGAYQPAAPIPLAEVAPAIRADLLRRRGDDLVRRRMIELRGKAKVEIVEAAVARASSPK